MYWLSIFNLYQLENFSLEVKSNCSHKLTKRRAPITNDADVVNMTGIGKPFVRVVAAIFDVYLEKCKVKPSKAV